MSQNSWFVVLSTVSLGSEVFFSFPDYFSVPFVCSADAHAYMLSILCVCTSKYHMEHNMTCTMALNLEVSVSARAHVQLSNMRHTKTDLNVPHGENNTDAELYI